MVNPRRDDLEDTVLKAASGVAQLRIEIMELTEQLQHARAAHQQASIERDHYRNELEKATIERDRYKAFAVEVSTQMRNVEEMVSSIFERSSRVAFEPAKTNDPIAVEPAPSKANDEAPIPGFLQKGPLIGGHPDADH